MTSTVVELDRPGGNGRREAGAQFGFEYTFLQGLWAKFHVDKVQSLRSTSFQPAVLEDLHNIRTG
jgi:hypothetical protein